MCLILFSYHQHPEYQLILAANRDEYYDRPTRALSFWADDPRVLAGRDLRSGGTWLGVSRGGRLGAITNYRDPATERRDAPSRGALVSDFLTGTETARAYLGKVARDGHHYNGFNLLLMDSFGPWHYSNRDDRIQGLNPGLYGLSNRLLDTPWPKVRRGKAALASAVRKNEAIQVEALFAILADSSRPPDSELPQTGVGLERERLLSPAFIASDVYGTRSSSIILLKKSGRVTFLERTYHDRETPPEKGRVREFTFTISE
jgi:uncharacterized protein with NRDE domain